MKKRTATYVGLLLAAIVAVPAQATLINRGRGLIYDDALNITWLQNANYAATLTDVQVNEIITAVPSIMGFPVQGGNFAKDLSGNYTGRMTWWAAMAWADQLTYAGYGDWRLPTALNIDYSGPCVGYNCTDSEIGHLFYVDGGLSAGQFITASTTLKATFSNLQAFGYWTNTDFAYIFDAREGGQFRNVTHGSLFAWAVHPGDVAVPEPETLGLFTAGWLGLILVRLRTRFSRHWVERGIYRA